MTTVKNPSSSSKAKIILPPTDAKSTTIASEKKDPSSKTKPEFVVRTNYPDSNAPLGVSVSKFNRTHVVVRNKNKKYKNHSIFLVFTTTSINQRWSSG
jgi:hypothetical protein